MLGIKLAPPSPRTVNGWGVRVMTDFNREHFERILAMAGDTDSASWDFSDNDLAALQWVTRRLDGLRHQLTEKESKVRVLQAVLAEAGEVLEALTTEYCDYTLINKLGDPEQQHNIKLARAALALIQQAKEVA